MVKLQEFSRASLILVKLRIYWSFSDCGCDNFTRLLSTRVHCPAFYRRSAITLRLWCGVDCKSLDQKKKSYFITFLNIILVQFLNQTSAVNISLHLLNVGEHCIDCHFLFSNFVGYHDDGR